MSEFITTPPKLVNNDYRELLKTIPDNSIDLVVTDPPYEHVTGGMKSKRFNRGSYKADSYMVQKMSQFKHDDIFEFLDLTLPKLKKANLFIFCSKLQLAHYFDYINQHKKLKFDLLVWDKSSETNKYSMKSSKFFAQDIEYVVRIYEPGVSLRKIWDENHEHADSSYYMKRQKYQQPKGRHETMKPIELLEKYILLASDEGSVVLDPFSGSGSTAIASIRTGRRFIGSELSEEYYRYAKENIEKEMDN